MLSGAPFRVVLPEFRRQASYPRAGGGPQDGEGGVGAASRGTRATGDEADQESGRAGADQAPAGRVRGSTAQSAERSQQRHQRGRP